MEERERGIYTKSSKGAEVGFVNGIVVRENIGAVNESYLDRMIRLCVEHCVYFVPIHFFLLFSLSKISVLLCVLTLKKIAQGLGLEMRENPRR